MNTLEALLVIIIMVLTFVVSFRLYSDTRRKNRVSSVQSANHSTNSVNSAQNVPEQHNAGNNSSGSDPRSYDNMTQDLMNENQEYFSDESNQGSMSREFDCVCGDSSTFDFATSNFGAPGLTYNEFVTSQGVDSTVINHHNEFVEERKGLGPEGQFTGKTYSPDSHESYDPIPWSGIRRPQYVEQCNPTQVPDVDTTLYKRNRPFCFYT